MWTIWGQSKAMLKINYPAYQVPVVPVLFTVVSWVVDHVLVVVHSCTDEKNITNINIVHSCRDETKSIALLHTRWYFNTCVGSIYESVHPCERFHQGVVEKKCKFKRGYIKIYLKVYQNIFQSISKYILEYIKIYSNIKRYFKTFQIMKSEVKPVPQHPDPASHRFFRTWKKIIFFQYWWEKHIRSKLQVIIKKIIK